MNLPNDENTGLTGSECGVVEVKAAAEVSDEPAIPLSWSPGTVKEVSAI